MYLAGADAKPKVLEHRGPPVVIGQVVEIHQQVRDPLPPLRLHVRGGRHGVQVPRKFFAGAVPHLQPTGGGRVASMVHANKLEDARSRALFDARMLLCARSIYFLSVRYTPLFDLLRACTGRQLLTTTVASKTLSGDRHRACQHNQLHSIYRTQLFFKTGQFVNLRRRREMGVHRRLSRGAWLLSLAENAAATNTLDEQPPCSARDHRTTT